jgi:hypothetical protein
LISAAAWLNAHRAVAELPMLGLACHRVDLPYPLAYAQQADEIPGAGL